MKKIKMVKVQKTRWALALMNTAIDKENYSMHAVIGWLGALSYQLNGTNITTMLGGK